MWIDGSDSLFRTLQPEAELIGSVGGWCVVLSLSNDISGSTMDLKLKLIK